MCHYSKCFLGWGLAITILNHLFVLPLGVPFWQVSEFSLFQPSFVTVEDFNNGIVYQPDTAPNRSQKRDTSDIYSPTIWNLLTCQHRRDEGSKSEKESKHNVSTKYETQGNEDSSWCLLSRKLLSSDTSKECEKMRSLGLPLAHIYRSHIGMELLSKFLHKENASIKSKTSAKHLFINPLQTGKHVATENLSVDTVSNHKLDMYPLDMADKASSSDSFGFFQMEDPNEELILTSKSLLDLNCLAITGIAMVVVACTIAVCVGVGGGGMFVPILILMLGFTTHESTGLAQALMVGGTLAGLVLNWQQRHPVADRPLIDVTMVLLLGPMQISGANVGVIINRMLPSWLIIAFTINVLGLTGYKTYVKGVEAWRKDQNGKIESAKVKNKVDKKCTNFLNCTFAREKADGVHKTEQLADVKTDLRKNIDENGTPSTKAGVSPVKSPLQPLAEHSKGCLMSCPSVIGPSSHARSAFPLVTSLARQLVISTDQQWSQSPISGLSDFVVTESVRRKSTALPPVSFSEAVSVLGFDDVSPSPFEKDLQISTYKSIVTRHRQRHPHGHPRYSGADRSSSSLNFLLNSNRCQFSTIEGPVRDVNDVLLLSMLPQNVNLSTTISEKDKDCSRRFQGSTIIVRFCRRIVTSDNARHCQKKARNVTYQEDTKLLNYIPSNSVFKISNLPCQPQHLLSTGTFEVKQRETMRPHSLLTKGLSSQHKNLKEKIIQTIPLYAKNHYVLDKTLGVLYVEQKIDDLVKQFAQRGTLLTSSSSARLPPQLLKTVMTESSSQLPVPELPKCPAAMVCACLGTSETLPSQDGSYNHEGRISVMSAVANPILKMLFYKPKMKPLFSINKPLSQETINAIYTDAMARYVQACITSDACVVLNCCMTSDEEQAIMSDHSTATALNEGNEKITDRHQWHIPLLEGQIMKFRIVEIEPKVTVVGQFRISSFRVESFPPYYLSLELAEIRPLFDRSCSNTDQSDEVLEPRVCALLVTRVSALDYNPPLPALTTTIDGCCWNNEKDHESNVNDVRPATKQNKSCNSFANFSPEFSFYRKSSPYGDVQRITSAPTNTQFPSTPESQISFPNVDCNCHILKGRHCQLHLCQQTNNKPSANRAAIISKNIQRLVKDQNSIQYKKWAVLLIIWVINSSLIFVKGGKSSPGLVAFCGAPFWTISASSVILPALSSLLISHYTIRLTRLRLSLDIPFVEGELVYTTYTVFSLLTQTFAAGVAAGVVGIGGGMILGPLMLSEGVSPQVTTAVNSTLVLFSSSSAAFHFMINGQADPIWSSFFFVICFTASLIGKYVLDLLVNKYNLGSVLVFLLLFIIILSMISMIVSGVLDIIAFGFTGFSSPCA